MKEKDISELKEDIYNVLEKYRSKLDTADLFSILLTGAFSLAVFSQISKKDCVRMVQIVLDDIPLDTWDDMIDCIKSIK